LAVSISYLDHQASIQTTPLIYHFKNFAYKYARDNC
jgi:hypothetical protein